MTLRIATRQSALAIAQSRWVARQLGNHHPGIEVALVPMLTRGDRITSVPLAQLGGKGLFVSELEAAVRDGQADLAVHSLKDVPAELAPGLEIAAVPEREDARDVLVSAHGSELDDFAAEARIGTSSARRICQLRRHRPDLDYALLRGNVDTRLRRLEQGRYAAIVLAYAGLNRLNLHDRPLWPLPPAVCIPAVGQGALALEARSDDKPTLELLSCLEHAPSRLAITAERAFLRRTGGDCNVPLAGYAHFEAGSCLRMSALVASTNGERYLTTHGKRVLGMEDGRAQARALGEQLAEELLAQGAQQLIEQALTLAARRDDPRSRPS